MEENIYSLLLYCSQKLYMKQVTVHQTDVEKSVFLIKNESSKRSLFYVSIKMYKYS